MFQAKICNDEKSYKVVPDNPLELDFAKLKAKYEVVKETPIAMVIKIEDVEIIVQKFGDLRFKECLDKEFVDRVAKEIYENA